MRVITPPRGLSGWLFFVGCGLVITPLNLISGLIQNYVPLFRNGSWELITNPESEHYISGFALSAYFELIVNLLLLAMSLYLINLFFKKRVTFPRFFIICQLLAIFIYVADGVISTYYFSHIGDHPNMSLKLLVIGVAFGVVRILYMLKSQRVKNTFNQEHSYKAASKTVAILSIVLVIGFCSYLMFVNKNSSKYRLNHYLKSVSSEIRQDLPVTLNQEMRLDEVYVSGTTLYFRYTLLNSTTNPFSENDEFQTVMTQAACNNPMIKQLVNIGAKIKYSYTDTSGVDLTAIRIDSSDCA